MTTLLRSAYFVLAIGAILFGGWFAGNFPYAMRTSPEQAAISVARKYAAAGAGAYTVRQVQPGERASTIVYIVVRGGQDHARVSLRNFMNIGWLEDTYEAMD